MSFQATAWVLSHSHSTGSTRLVALAIAQHANKDGLNSWPSVQTLASEAKVCRKSVFLALRKLSAIGELNKISGGGRRHTNRYHLPLVSPQKSLTFPQARANKRCNPFPQTVQGLHPNKKEPSRSNTKAAQPLRAPSHPLRSEQEQRRIVNARDSRLQGEDEYRREVFIGAGPVACGVSPKHWEFLKARGL